MIWHTVQICSWVIVVTVRERISGSRVIGPADGGEETECVQKEGRAEHWKEVSAGDWEGGGGGGRMSGRRLSVFRGRGAPRIGER